MIDNSLEEKIDNIKNKVLKLEGFLADQRRQNNYLPVIGEGNHQADIFFIGEAPGKNEALSGRPFCGSAGKILDSYLAAISLNRQDIYITNIVKDRPPVNRDPQPEEIELYSPFLIEQIELIKPKILVTLGRYATKFVLDKYGLAEAKEVIGNLHGRSFSGHEEYGEVKIIPFYHPAATIYNQKLKEVLLVDFQKLKILYEKKD